MYGLTHQALTRWMRSLPNGEEILARVLEQSGIDGSPDDFFRHYTDQETMGFLPIVQGETGLGPDEIMFEAGMHAMETFIGNGFEPAMRTLGDNFFDLLANLDSLHDNYLASFPHMKAPSIRPVRNDDDTLSIHYYSAREGLAPFFMGMVKSCAADIFDLQIDIHHRVKKGKQGDHDIFHVFLDPTAGFPVANGEISLGKEMSVYSPDKMMTSTLFPWHFVVDKELKVISLGKKLGSRMKKESIGVEMRQLFKLLSPVIKEVTFESLLELKDKPFIFATSTKMMMNPEEYHEQLTEEMLRQQAAKNPNEIVGITDHIAMLQNGAVDDDNDSESIVSSKAPSALGSSFTSARSSIDMMDVKLKRLRNVASMKLHGQIIHDEENESIIFAGTPMIKGLEEMEAQAISLEDLPIHSHAREVLYSSMYQTVSIQNSADIQKKLLQLDSSMTAVNEKKAQIDGLLHSILPPVVAESLAKGLIPEAESYEKVSGFHHECSHKSVNHLCQPPIHKIFTKEIN
eukprot:m.227763 g.227763  ORF g.227763 m.227763 type:complete len:515 (+) comp13872_c0_seq7:204-1748(+)